MEVTRLSPKKEGSISPGKVRPSKVFVSLLLTIVLGFIHLQFVLELDFLIALSK